MADYKVVDAEKLDADLTDIADEVRLLAGTSEKMSMDEMTENVAQANEIVGDQSALIAQIKSALEGKASGGGGDTEAIEQMIDESGVLDSTEGTVEEKVEGLIDKGKFHNFFQEHLRSFSFRGNGNITEIPTIDCANIISLWDAFNGCNNRNLKVISLKNTHNVADWRNFIYNTYVETVGVVDFSKADKTGVNAFGGNTSVINLEIASSTIHFSVSIPFPKLSAESIQSIFDGLAPVTTAQTLTLHANAKILQSQVDSANGKGWTVAGGTVVSEEEYYG